MANFKTHITTSTAVGVAVGAYGATMAGMPLTSCVVAGGLCSLSGMLPDLDSDNGVPIRETFGFAAAVIPVLMLDRFAIMGFSHEDMVLASGVMYCLVRFGVSWLFKRYTVHRGMWHSLPAAAICGMLAYMICSCDHRIRMYKSMAVVLGFMSHLILDEIYSVDFRNRRIKKSFGTAIKLFSNKWWPNVSVYGKLAVLIVAATIGERKFMEYFREPANRFHYVAGKAGEVVSDVLGHAHDHLQDLGLHQSHGEHGSHGSPSPPASANVSSSAPPTTHGPAGAAAEAPPAASSPFAAAPPRASTAPRGRDGNPTPGGAADVAPLYTSPAPTTPAPHITQPGTASNGSNAPPNPTSSPGVLPLPKLPPAPKRPDSFGGPLFNRY